MRFLDLSVKWKLTAVFEILLLLILLFQVLYFPEQQTRQAIEALKIKALTVCELVASDAEDFLGFEDSRAMQSTLKGAQKDEDLVFITILKKDGTVFATLNSDTSDNSDTSKLTPLTNPNQVAQLIHEGGGQTEAYEQGNLIRVKMPVADGFLLAGFSTERILAQRSDVFWQTLFVGLLTLAIGTLVVFWIGSSLAKPIRNMTAVAQRIAAGDLTQPSLKVTTQDEIGLMGSSFNTMLSSLREINEKALAVANGNLSVTIEGRGDLFNAFREMVDNLRKLVVSITRMTERLSTTSRQILAAASNQEQGATEQSSAVEETRLTMENLVDSSRKIAESCRGVAQTAESTLKNNQHLADRIHALSEHTERITEILEIIKDIANKSDLLALNAALEGTKAGEVGHGFALVAEHMQRLAENVMGSVRDIKALTVDIREATNASVLATEAATKMATDTFKSSHQISLITQQQQNGTEQVTKAIDDIADIARQSATASIQASSATKDLLVLAEELQTFVAAFQLSKNEEERY